MQETTQKNNSNGNNIKNFIHLNNQNKVIIIGWIVSSLLIFVTAWFVIHNTQKKIYESYYNFGLMLTHSLAVESLDLTANIPYEQKIERLKLHADSVTESSDDIAYIEFKDNLGGVIYSNRSNKKLETKGLNRIEISIPLVAGEGDSYKTTIGSVQVGLTGHTMKIIGKATRNSMIVIFTIAWFVAIFAVFVNTWLITRQITILSDGVKKISSGKFGHKLTSKDLWGEIKELFESFNDMSIRLRQYEEKNIDQLTYERNRLEAVLMGIANGVVVCDNYDKVLLVNNAALKMFDIKANELIGMKIQDYYDNHGSLAFRDEIARYKETPLDEMENKPFEFQVALEHKTLKTLITPMFSKSMEYQGYIMILHDRTKEVEIEKLKDTFISNVSHELRTPVTVLRSYIDTLHNYSDNFDEATKQEFIAIMNQEADRLNKMVNDILDFSRLESPNVQLEKTPTEIKPVLELTVTSLKVLFEEKNISVSVIIEPNLPKLLINTESIERVIKNLLSNAIKYTPENGRIKVRAELDKTCKFVEVSVEDNGMGIEEKHLEKIFDRFYRIETKTHTIKGTGLGLHIVKTAIEKHHEGQVFVESKLNEGSKFGFRLPVYDEKSQPQQVAVEPAQQEKTQEPEISSANNEKNEWEFTFTKQEKE